jgi:hypothetical protein
VSSRPGLLAPPGRPTKTVIAVTLLALLLLTAVLVALLAAVIMMILGHVVGGLALFAGSVLAPHANRSLRSPR